MIKVHYTKYMNDYHQFECVQTFRDLSAFADYIFGSMKQAYDNRFAMYFPRPMGGEISWTPSYNDYRHWCHRIDDEDGILFSTGKTTSGQKFMADCVKDWCEQCEQRRHKPVFNFVNK